jgi:hypothetical protein
MIQKSIQRLEACTKSIHSYYKKDINMGGMGFTGLGKSSCFGCGFKMCYQAEYKLVFFFF